jgi:hypothetical protein
MAVCRLSNDDLPDPSVGYFLPRDQKEASVLLIIALFFFAPLV